MGRAVPAAAMERYGKKHIVAVGPVAFGVAGMTHREEYLLRAAELSAKAQAERENIRKLEFENLARAYLRLAKQAERNSQTNIVRDAAKKGA
jgi:hypothetical protein